MADLTGKKENVFHQYKNLGYTLYLSYLHPDDLKKSTSEYPLAGNVFACSRDKIDPALVAPEVKGFSDYELLLDNLEYSTFPMVDNWKGASFASVMTFTIKEPYGMSLLEILSAMHRNDSKTRAGGPSEMNYLTAPYCLTIEYAAYDTDDSSGKITKFPGLRRQIPLILREVSFTMSSSGAVYYVKAMPLAETPQIENSKIEETITVKGDTVQDLLISFQAALNLKEIKKWEAKYKQSSEPVPGPFVLYNFLYQDMNADLLKSKLVIVEPNGQGKTQLQLATRIPMGNTKQAAQDREKRPVITNNTEVEYVVTANQKTVTQVIEEIIVSSVWFHELYRSKEINGKKQRENPIVKWPKIFTYIDITQPRDPATNTFNRVINYAVVLHEYLNTSTINYDTITQDQIDAIEKHKELKTIREYNYLFTGKNIDILEFDMKFNMLFYNSLIMYDNRFGAGSQTAQHTNPKFKQDDSLKNTARAPGTEEADTTAWAGGLPASKIMTPPASANGLGPDAANFFAQVRQDFERIFDTGSLTDFQSITMTIVGDPAFINDGLYRWDKFLEMIKDRQGAVAILNDDYGTIDWTQDVFIKLNVKRPIKSIDGQSTQYQISPLMSRTYRILYVKHTFKDGKFTQELFAVFTPPVPKKAKEELRRTLENGVDEDGNNVGIALPDETGAVGNIRRNPETGELYDATGLGYQTRTAAEAQSAPRISKAGGSTEPTPSEQYPTNEKGEGLV